MEEEDVNDEKKNYTISFPIALKERIDTEIKEETFSGYLAKLALDDFRNKLVFKNEGEIDQRIRKLMAEIELLEKARDNVLMERRNEDAFNSWPQQKRNEIVAYASRINSPSYWRVVAIQRIFELWTKRDDFFWKAGLTPEEYDKIIDAALKPANLPKKSNEVVIDANQPP